MHEHSWPMFNSWWLVHRESLPSWEYFHKTGEKHNWIYICKFSCVSPSKNQFVKNKPGTQCTCGHSWSSDPPPPPSSFSTLALPSPTQTEQHSCPVTSNNTKSVGPPTGSGQSGWQRGKTRARRRWVHKQWPLTGVSADELWPGALLGLRRVRGANQLVLGHLGVGLGELQPQGLGDLWIKPDPLRSDRENMSAWSVSR